MYVHKDPWQKRRSVDNERKCTLFCNCMESHHRSIIKTVTWRVIATVITLGIVFTFTGSLHKASVITLVTATVLAIGYYFHERFWNKTHWGRRVR